eukprot:6181761-Pleurochrysis_carterae.AAC.1
MVSNSHIAAAGSTDLRNDSTRNSSVIKHYFTAVPQHNSHTDPARLTAAVGASASHCKLRHISRT